MNAATGQASTLLAATAAIAVLLAGCYYGPTHPYENSYYADRSYVPFMRLHIGVFSSDEHDYDHRGHHWRDVPYHRHEGGRHRGRGHYDAGRDRGRHGGRHHH